MKKNIVEESNPSTKTSTLSDNSGPPNKRARKDDRDIADKVSLRSIKQETHLSNRHLIASYGFLRSTHHRSFSE